MRVVGVLMTIGAALLVGTPALADGAPGLSVGPYRQLLGEGETVSVHVANTGTARADVVAEFYLGNGHAVFRPTSEQLLSVDPIAFSLKPNEQIDVAVTQTAPIPSTMAAVGFRFAPTQDVTSGVQIDSVVLAQFVVDEAAFRRANQPPEPHPFPWWLWIGLGVGAVVLVLLGRVSKRG